MAQRRIYGDITETMGDTPLIQLNRVGAGLPARIVVKHEGFNPFNSVKDRIGTAMIDDALRDGSLRPGMIIVEPTSGNTGIGIAYAAVARGFRCVFTMPETMTIERRNMLRALGCRVVHYRTTGPEIWEGTKGAVDIFVAGVGTGGTITGAGRYLCEKKPEIRIRGGGTGREPGSLGWRAFTA